MRTALFLLVGALLLAASLLLGKLFSLHYPNAMLAAAVTFCSLWLLISGFNMWVGVTQAGYRVSEELPVFLLIFTVPVLVAVILKWRVL